MLKKVILCPNPYRDAQLRVAREAKRVLDEAGCPNVVCLPFRNQEKIDGFGLAIEPLQQELRGADLIVAFGGDGTILHLSKTAAHRDVPVLGVNLGSLGFMAELESKDLARLRDLCNGKYDVESRMMLDVNGVSLWILRATASSLQAPRGRRRIRSRRAGRSWSRRRGISSFRPSVPTVCTPMPMCSRLSGSSPCRRRKTAISLCF